MNYIANDTETNYSEDTYTERLNPKQPDDD